MSKKDIDKNKNIEEFEDDFDEDLEVITLIDENDQEVDFYLLFTMPFEGNEYAFLRPVEESDEFAFADDEVLIMKINDISDEESELVSIEDEDLMQRILDEYNSLEFEDDEE